MYNFTVVMGLADYVPVAFFAVTAILLLQDLYHTMGKGTYILLAAGSTMTFLAGFCKATWKLLYAANICDFKTLEEMFLPMNSLGLLFIGLAVLAMVCKPKKAALAVAPVVYDSSLPFILAMVVGLGGLCAGLGIVAKKMKKAWLIALFAGSFALSMGMGYMGTRDSTLAWVNWAEQGINSASQLCLMLGTILLHKAGLKDWRKAA